ncbi:MAG: hypothetical protein GWM87_10745 [Xanthomonadales bacterium]|nr:hypothetical protein [Xanthomonadales bacterium]NIX13361.1 hypothetical protein [Xanthomonadales bacterium]
MRNLIIVSATLFLAVSPAGFAQEEEEEAPPTYVQATYFYCHVSKEGDADKVVKEQFAPIYDAAVEAGTINAWGWLAHRNGGKWRRVLYHSANGIDALMDAGDKLYAATDEAVGDDTTFGDACGGHDDYIWQSEDVGTGAAERGPAGFSVYFYCDQTRESRADEIVTEHFAPAYDKLVEDGKITSWGWSQHFVGGKIRRLLTMTGDSHKAVLHARNDAINAVFGDEEATAAGQEFSAICGDHLDYMWDIQIENP